MDTDKIIESIKEKASDKNGSRYITCHTALEIAGQLDVAPIEVGNLCNELGIKIINCQLGCF